ncbi:GAF domain-containing protein [Streptomyces sp. NPDC001728]|uniref:GAF domain-containing protein n=1 Tax=Streptomyces sp. NPDC001728 TaxID=3154396 RepID=UPI00332E522F
MSVRAPSTPSRSTITRTPQSPQPSSPWSVSAENAHKPSTPGRPPTPASPPPPCGQALTLHAATGHDSQALNGKHLPTDTSLCGAVLANGTPLISDDTATDERAHSPAAAWSPTLGPAMFAPLTHQGQNAGVLFVTRRPGRPAFDTRQLDLLGAFVTQAALTRQLAQQRADAEETHSPA